MLPVLLPVHALGDLVALFLSLGIVNTLVACVLEVAGCSKTSVLAVIPVQADYLVLGLWPLRGFDL